MQLCRKQIDRNSTQRESHCPPGGSSLARRMDDPSADLACNRAFSKDADECAWRKDTSFRMPPPEQGFGSHYGPVRKSDLRLKIKLELVACKSSSQLHIEGASRLRLCAKHRLEMTAHATAGGLCLIERKIGVRDQVIDIEPIVGGNSDACAASDVERVIAIRN